MPSPFPGMDPYLEQPSHWPDVHHELISATRAALRALIGRNYHVRIEERRYTHNDVAKPIVLETMIDETVRQPYISEILSPDNKVARSQGLKSFRMKRLQVMRSPSHWVEIDLLRRGVSLPLRKRIRPHHYLVHVSPTQRRPQGLVWPIRLSQRLPVIPVPLRSGDDDAPLDLQAVLDAAYDRAGYDTDIDYTKPPVPPLRPRWTAWSDRLLREKGLRPSSDAG